MNVRLTGRVGILLAAILALVAVSAPGMAVAKDRNKDRIPDRWEKQNKLSLKRDQRKLDQDADGLKNRGEWLADTNPRDRDSDDDGTNDSKENAGFISSYDATAQTLKLTLYGGGDISGSVTDRTRVKCEDESADPPAGDPVGPPTGATSSGSESEGHHGTGGPGTEDEGTDEDKTEDPESEDQGTDDEGGGHGRYGSCSLDNLAVDVVVREADVKYSSGGPVFTKLEIEKPVAAR